MNDRENQAGSDVDEPLVRPLADDDSATTDASAPFDQADNEPLATPVQTVAAESFPAESGPADSTLAQAAPVSTAPPSRADSHNMLPPRERRRSGVERLLVRSIATGGIVAIGVAISAIMTSSNSQGWLIGLVVSVVTVVLAAILWSSRQL